MEINAAEFITVMKKNFDYKIVDTTLGPGVLMNPFQAFIYSTVTGSGYLDDPLYPFTPKGLMKLFYNALDYKLVTGIFDNTTLKNTPYLISRSKKFLFDSDKVVIPVEFESEIELQSKLKTFISENRGSHTRFIIQRIEKSKKGNGMEPFMEYLACETMKNKDLIVENQIPLSHNTGSPDFGGYRVKTKMAFNKIHLIELALIRVGWKIDNKNDGSNQYCIVGEAKTSTTQMKTQIDKYIQTKFFDECYEIHPNKELPSDRRYGLITIDENYKIKIIKSEISDVLSESNKQTEYMKWLNNYLKYYLIANLTNDEFSDFYQEKTKKKISKVTDITLFINSLTYEEIFDRIQGVCDGTVQ